MLTRKECSALRGIAILAIMLHNYCHWLRLAVKENEYTFSSLNNSRLIEALSKVSLPQTLPHHDCWLCALPYG